MHIYPMENHRPLVYLACPYSHPELSVREDRFNKVNEITAKLTNSGLSVFSPISMTHPLATKHSLPGDWEFWKKFDTDFISCANTLYVLTIDGWEKSTGVQAEIVIARNQRIPIIYLNDLGEVIKTESPAQEFVPEVKVTYEFNGVDA